MKKIISLLIVLLLVTACSSVKLPKVKFNAYPIGYSQKIEGDSLVISLNNVLECPVRIVLNDSVLNKSFERKGLVILNPKEEKTISVFLNGEKKYNSGVNFMLGKAGESPKNVVMSLPFLPRKKYEIIQGYNGTLSHQGELSKYELDFNLKVGDTICAADSGYVVGIVDEYSKSGRDSSWKDFSNFVTIFNPKSGIFTEYAHIKTKGILVNIGEYVSAGKPIALSGMTGWTTVAHLHFVAYFRNKNWKSEPLKIKFIEGYIGEELKEKSIVEKN